MGIEKVKANLRPLALALYCVVLAVLPVFYRGGEYWWLPTALFGCLSGLWLWFVSLTLLGPHDHHGDLPVLTPRWHFVFFAFLAALSWGIIQCVPFGNGFVGVFSSQTVEVWRTIPELRARFSLFPTATQERLVLVFCAFCVLWVTRCFCTHRRYARWILWAIVLSALFDSLVGFYQLISPETAARCPFVPLGEGDAHGAVRGIFLNRNHFALHLAMGISALGGLMMSHIEGGHEEKSHHSHGKRHRSRKNIFFVVGLFLLYSAALASLSRGGFLAANLSILILGGCWFYRHRHCRSRHSSRRRTGIAMAVIFLVAIFFSLPFVLEKLSSRFQTLMQEDGLSSDGRVQVWHSSLRLIGDYWATGVGMGAYGDAIQAYAVPELNQARIEHAHNDYLELFSEVGVPMAVILLGIIGYAVFHALRRVKEIHDPGRFYCVWACLAALAGCAVHEFFDYNLQAYPNALCAAALLGVLLALCAQEEEGESQRQIPKWLYVSVALVLLCCMVPAVVGVCHSVGRHRLWLCQQPQYHPRGQSCVPPSERMEIASSAYEKNPSDPRVIQRYATEVIQSGNRESDRGLREEAWGEGIRLVGEALAFRPAMYELWQLRGLTRYAVGDIAGSLGDFERAMALAPTLLAPKMIAGQYYRRVAAQMRNVDYAIRGEQILRGIMVSHPAMTQALLPELLTEDTPYRDLLRDITPTQELGFDILERLVNQHRFEEALDCLKSIPGWSPSDKAKPVERQLRLAEYGLAIANAMNQPTDEKLSGYLSALKEYKLWKEEGNLERQPGRYMILLQHFEESPAGPLPGHRLQVAKRLQIGARDDNLVDILMPLVYPFQPYPPTEEERQQALAMVSPYHWDILDAKGFQMAAFQALLAENESRIQELREFYRKNAERSVQQPGIAFNKLEWLNAQLLEQHDSPGEDSISGVLAFMQGAAQVLALEASPNMFRNGYETLEVAVRLRVQNGTKKPIEPLLRLSTPDGVFATVKLTPVEGKRSILWKCGEEITYHAEIPNVLTQAVIKGASFADVSSILVELMQDAKTPTSPRCMRLVKVFLSP